MQIAVDYNQASGEL